MRVLLDTNILVSAVLIQGGPPGLIYQAWFQGAFTLLTCEEQIAELRATLRKPAIARRIRPYHSGRMINDLRRLAALVKDLPRVHRSPDPEDDFLLAAAQAGSADYLVTGDKSGLLALVRHQGTRILSAGEFAGILK
jgi:putative PIN family toxin of toxin-antitoxin system